MEGISISSERVAAAGGGVQDVSSLLGKEIVIMGELLGEIRAGWQSDQAAPRFAAGLQGYLDQAAVLRNALASHGQSLVSTGQRFAEAEATLAAAIPGVR